MKISARFLMGLAVSAFMLAALATQPVMAQDKAKAAKAEKGKATQKVLLENEKVRVVETRFKPGDEGANVARPFRVTRALKGGTIQRTYADGKTDKIQWKTGEVRGVGPDPVFTPKNIGKTEIVLYVVQPK